jgi:hypothetical protein
MQRIKEIDDMKMCIVQSDSVQTADVLKIRYEVTSNTTSEKRTRAYSPDPHSIRSRRAVNDKSPSPTKSDTLRKKMRLIESYEAWVAQGGELDKETKAMIAKKSTYQARLDEAESNPTEGMMDQDYWDDADAEMEGSPGLAYRYNAPSSKKAELSSHHHHRNSRTSGDDMDMDGDPEEPKPKIIMYNDSIQNLIDRHPEMKQAVNPARKRKTAMDMWDDVDNRRMRMLTIS